jgi:pimeloyl-ACP methyl ester carboxylesterase
MNLKTIGLLMLLGIFLVCAPVARAQESEVLEGRGELEMVLVHGLGSSAEVWDAIKPYLEGTFKVAIFEMAGHGTTQPIADPTIEKEVGRLAEFIKEKGFAYPTIVGHGMGGMIALKYALAHPADVHRLVMMDSAPIQLASPEQKKEVSDQLIDNYDEFVANRYMAMSPMPDVTELILDSALKTDSGTFVSLLLDSFDFDVTGELPTLSVPLLVVGSELLFPNSDVVRPILGQIGFGNARALRVNAGHVFETE